MKLQYKAAGLMIFIGATILLLSTVFYSRQNRQIVLQKELRNIQNISEEIAQHMNSHLIANAAIANTVSSATIIRDTLRKSNVEFEVLSEIERKNKIDALNQQWKEAKDQNDPFIQEHLTNPTAKFLKLQQIIQPGLYGEIFLTNRYGAMIASTGKLTTLAHAHKYWWKASYQEGKGRVFFDDRGFDTSVEGYVVGVVVPVRNGNEIVGILKCNINITGPLTNIVQEYGLHHLGKIYIVRTNGLIVSEKGKIPLSRSLPDNLVKHIQTKKTGAEFIEEKDRKLVAFSLIDLTLGSERFGFGGSYESIDHIKGNKGEAWHIVITLDEEIAIKDADETTRVLMITGLIFIVVTSVIAWFLGKWIANPLVKLTDTTRKIGEGQLDTRITIATKGEVGTLAKAYNQMLENLQKTLTSRDNLSKEIEKRKQTEREMQENEKYLEIAQKMAKLGHWELDTQTREVAGSDELFRIFELNRDEFTLEAFASVVHPDDLEYDMRHINNGLKKGEPWDIEHRLLLKDGTIKTVRTIGEPVVDQSGIVSELIGTVQDMTELKQIEESHYLKANIIDASSSAITTWDLEEKITYANLHFLKLWGFNDPEEFLGKHFTDFWLLGDQNEEIMAALRTGGMWTGELKAVRADGSLFDVQVSAATIVDSNNNPVAFTSSSLDITERKRAEEEFQNEKLLTEEYINSLPGLFYVFDKQSFIQWNRQWEKVTGYSTSEISKMYGPDFFKGSDKTLIEERMSEVFVKGESEAEAELVTKQGIRIPYYFTGLRKEINGKPHLIGLGIDITERKQVDEALRESEEKYRTLIKNIPSVSYRCECDENWTMRIISSEVEVPGYPASDFIDNNVRTWASMIHPDDKEDVEAFAMEKISNQEPYNLEYRTIGKNENIRWVNENGQGIFNKEGKPLFLDGVIVDITKRKQAEEQIAASLKEKETLLQEIHHRVKNNMQVISSLLKLQANSMEDERLKAALMDSQNRVQSMSAIHETLYQSDDLSAVDMKTYLSSLAEVVAQNYSIGSKVNLKIEAENVLIGAKQASPVGLIVNELITNSLKYAFPDNQKGKIEIILEKTENQIELEYSDNGIGIPEDFDWKNTKSMGLNLVKILAENQLDGSIDMESNNGTKFTIKFNIDKA